MADATLFCVYTVGFSGLRSTVLHVISDERSFLTREGKLIAPLDLQPSQEGLLTPNHVPLQRTPRIYKQLYE